MDTINPDNTSVTGLTHRLHQHIEALHQKISRRYATTHPYRAAVDALADDLQRIKEQPKAQRAELLLHCLCPQVTALCVAVKQHDFIRNS